jgi:hypothetical protein
MGRYSLKRKTPFQVKRGGHELFPAAFDFYPKIFTCGYFILKFVKLWQPLQ